MLLYFTIAGLSKTLGNLLYAQILNSSLQQCAEVLLVHVHVHCPHLYCKAKLLRVRQRVQITDSGNGGLALKESLGSL